MTTQSTPSAARTTASILDDLVDALEADVVGPFERKSALETLPIPPAAERIAEHGMGALAIGGFQACMP